MPRDVYKASNIRECKDGWKYNICSQTFDSDGNQNCAAGFSTIRERVDLNKYLKKVTVRLSTPAKCRA